MIDMVKDYFGDPKVRPAKGQILNTIAAGFFVGAAWGMAMSWWTLLITIPLMMMFFFAWDASGFYRGEAKGYAEAGEQNDLLERFEHAMTEIAEMEQVFDAAIEDEQTLDDDLFSNSDN